MDKGETNLSPKELKTLAAMAKAAENYEDNVLVLKLPNESKSIIDTDEQ